MATTRRSISARSIRWTKSSAGGSKFAYVGTCKVTALTFGPFMVERVNADLMPTSTMDTVETLALALELVASEPEPRCLGCGRVVAGPQYVNPDLNCPSQA